MASKKYSFLAGALCLLASSGFAQNPTTGTTGTTGTGYDVADSSIVPSRRMPQHTEFMNGTYNFPAKPRSQWEVGIKGGMVTLSSDVAAKPSFNVIGAHIRKAFGYVFSARLEYMQGVAKGLNWQPSGNYQPNPAWWDRYLGTSSVYYNYRTELKDLSLEGLFTLNNIRFHKAKSGVNIYALAGVGALAYTSYVNALNDKGAAITNPFDPALRYPFASISTNATYKNRKDIKDALKNMLDDTYETRGESYDTRRAQFAGHTLDPVFHVGAGMEFKLNNKFNIALEDRFTFTNDDLLDGQRWSEQSSSPGFPVLSPHWDSYNYLTLGINMNLGAKSVEPLWWQNPLDYVYSEVRNPRLMRLPKPVLPDSDGDGVTDQFDQEQTPPGCPVDSHGVSRDTDGDGVPDCRDKELVTPTVCQPVDADGVGKCPCPDSCGTVMKGNDCATLLGPLPSVTFTGNSVTVSKDAQSLLASVASRLRNNPDCKVVVTSYGASSKQQQQRGWDRVNAVINYLVEKEGISSDRFFWQLGQEGGDPNTVDLRGASTEDQGLPTTVPAPHPNLRGRK